MKCEFCDSDTTTKKVRKHHWFEGELYLVENVEAEVCSECGERYFHATTLDRIDQMIREDHPAKRILSVKVLSA